MARRNSVNTDLIERAYAVLVAYATRPQRGDGPRGLRAPSVATRLFTKDVGAVQEALDALVRDGRAKVKKLRTVVKGEIGVVPYYAPVIHRDKAKTAVDRDRILEAALRLIAEHGSTTGTAVAQDLGTDTAETQRAMKALSDKGLLSRAVHDTWQKQGGRWAGHYFGGAGTRKVKVARYTAPQKNGAARTKKAKRNSIGIGYYAGLAQKVARDMGYRTTSWGDGMFTLGKSLQSPALVVWPIGNSLAASLHASGNDLTPSKAIRRQLFGGNMIESKERMLATVRKWLEELPMMDLRGEMRRNPQKDVSPATLKRAATMIKSGKLDKATVAEIATAVKAPKGASLKDIAKRVNEVGTKVAVATASSVGVPEPVTRAALKVSTAIQTAPFRAAKWAFGKVKEKMRGKKNPVWTRAYINKLPDSAFLYVETGGTKDEQGKTVPRSLRHFPVRDLQGRVSEAHARNAISRIPQSTAKGLTPKVMKQLQQKARSLLFFGKGSDAVRSIKKPLPSGRSRIPAAAANKGLKRFVPWKGAPKKNATKKNPTVTTQLRGVGGFTFEGRYFTIKERPRSGELLYRADDATANMWTPVMKTLRDPMARLEFRKLLALHSGVKLPKLHARTSAGVRRTKKSPAKKGAKRNASHSAAHMWFLSKDTTGRYIVSIGDPTKSGSTLKRRFQTLAELRDWVKYEMPEIVSAKHVVDRTGKGVLKGAVKNPARRAEFSWETLPRPGQLGTDYLAISTMAGKPIKLSVFPAEPIPTDKYFWVAYVGKPGAGRGIDGKAKGIAAAKARAESAAGRLLKGAVKNASRRNADEADIHTGDFRGWESARAMGEWTYSRTWAGHYVSVTETPDPPRSGLYRYRVFIDDKRLGKQDFREVKQVFAAIKKAIGPMRKNPVKKLAAKGSAGLARRVARLETVVRKAEKREAKEHGTKAPKLNKGKRNTAPKQPTKAQYDNVAFIFKALRDTAATTCPEVMTAKLVVDPSIHDSRRHYAATSVKGRKIEVRIAPELALEPKIVIVGVLRHELGHATAMATKTMPKGKNYDKIERHADRTAEKLFHTHIYYDSRGVEVSGPGAKGARPRPAGLR